MLGEGLLLFAEYFAKAVNLSFARLILSFDRDATKTFWYTFDADDNRNITPWQRDKRWSLSIFSVCPILHAAYDIKIHRATIYAYHGAETRWSKLEDRAGAVFPGPRVRSDVEKFLAANPPSQEKEFRARQSDAVAMRKIGVFDHSLSAEFVLSSRDWGAADGDYVALTVILQVNTKYVAFTCLVPEMTAAGPRPAYFIGQPTIYKVNDEPAILERAIGELKNAEQLGRAERATVYWKIS